MPARLLDPAALAASFRAELRAEVTALPEPVTLLGLLPVGHAPSETYAAYTRAGCDSVGIRFQLRTVTPDDVEVVVREAGQDPDLHGILVYYPVGARDADRWLRELVDPRKDVEGLHSFGARCLSENRRFLDDEHRRKAILPCTPLAIVKLLEAAGAGGAAGPRPLQGVKGGVVNRSEIVGLPLAAMLANDGAEVVSFDLEGERLFQPDEDGHQSHTVGVSRAEALAQADVVVTGVPSRDFRLVEARELREGAICLNFSTLRNFADDVVERAGVFVPRVGPMTVTMALRNTLRLYTQQRAARR